MATLEQFARIASLGQDRFWDFLEVKDVLNLSVCARATAGLLVPKKTLNDLLERNERFRSVGSLKLSFPSDVSTGLLRRILYRLSSMREGVIMIDDRKGRIVLDIGSAFQDQSDDVPATNTSDHTDEEENEDENAQIFKQLEITSFDEYDDFNPRHPLPRERAHRRGDSYFNSDIEMVVGEIGAMGGVDLSQIAKMALAGGDDEEDTGGAQTLRPLSGVGIAAAEKPPLPPAGQKLSAKDRILSKTRTAGGGAAKAKTARANDDDDDDN
jgi:hypothetical protein